MASKYNQAMRIAADVTGAAHGDAVRESRVKPKAAPKKPVAKKSAAKKPAAKKVVAKPAAKKVEPAPKPVKKWSPPGLSGLDSGRLRGKVKKLTGAAKKRR